MQSGNLNFLEHSGPLQSCNGTALHFFTVPSVWLPNLINVHMLWVGLDANQYGVIAAALFTMLEHVWFTDTVGNEVRVNSVY
jgi:hypothetical protein